MADWYVMSAGGHDANGDGSRDWPFKTIAKAITVAISILFCVCSLFNVLSLIPIFIYPIVYCVL